MLSRFSLPSTPSRFLLLVALVGGALLLGALTATSPLLGVVATLGMIGILVGGALLTRPWHLFAFYLFLLPPHVLLMALLLTHGGLSVQMVKLVSAWKEGALLLLLLFGSWRLLTTSWRPALLDLLAFLYVLNLGIALTFSLSKSLPLSVLAYGLRDHLLPLLLYFVGRFVPLSETHARTLFRWLLVATLLFATLGIVERLIVPTSWHVSAGIPRYYEEVLQTPFGAHLQGLPPNYWTSGNSARLRRAVSVYGSSQPFALSFLLFVPVSAYGVFSRRVTGRHLAALALLCSLGAVVLTITRFTIVICLLLLALGAVLFNRRALVIIGGLLATVLLLFVIALGASSSVRLLTYNTLTFQDHSSDLRLQIWGETAQVVARQPIGYGIGTVGQTAERFSGESTQVVAIEGQISKIAVELGVQGLLLYLSFLLVASVSLLRAALRSPDPYRGGLCFACGLTFIGLILNGITTEWHNSPSLVYPVWWLAGACVTYSLQQRRAGRAVQPPTLPTATQN